jgi:hypothetical protein
MTPEHQRDLEGRLLALAHACYRNGWPADDIEPLLRFYAVIASDKRVGTINVQFSNSDQIIRGVRFPDRDIER